MRVKLLLTVGDDYLYRWITLPFLPAVDMQLELATGREQAWWTRVTVVELAWHVADDWLECDCDIFLDEVDDMRTFLLARGWLPLE